MRSWNSSVATMFKAWRPILRICLVVLPLSLASCSNDEVIIKANSAITIPQAPSGVSHALGSAPARVILSWNSSPTADHYRVYRDIYSGFSPSAATHIDDTTLASYTDLSVTAGKIYYYIITIVSFSGYEGPPSAEVVASLTPPSPPQSILAVAGDAQVAVAWSPVNGASSYTVYRSLVSGVTATASALASSITSTKYYDVSPPLLNGQAYYYAVASSNAFGDGTLSSEVAATPLTTSGTGTIIIHGMVKYEDREYSATNGLTGNSSLKPVRFADIEVVDAASPLLQSIASGATRSNGSYSFSLPASMLGKNVYVQVISSATVSSGSAATQTATVMHLDRRLYGANSPQFLLTGSAQVNFAVPVDMAAGAFNILDVLTAGYEFINSLQSSPKTLSLDSFWDKGSTIGTWYCTGAGACLPAGEGIYVFSDAAGTGDTDEFDDDVLWHEFGHFAANKCSLDDSPGGIHYLNENDLDLRLTWSEGWGSFFSGAVKYWLQADPDRKDILSMSAGTPLSKYIDTYNNGSHLTIDVATPELSPYCVSSNFRPNPCKYASNEVAVANILWNLMAEPTLGMQPVWDVFAGYLPLTTPVNLESFWDGWLGQRSPGPSESALLKSVFADRLIDYTPDTYESDGSLATASTYTVGSSAPQLHTLYPVADGDFVIFYANANALYTITTSSLRNGADTSLRLYDTFGALITTDDNGNGTGITYVAGVNYDYYDVFDNYVYPRNNDSNLSSKITFVPQVTGTYSVSISSSIARPKTSGRYGSYTLTITTP